jgi:hypothetical protein
MEPIRLEDILGRERYARDRDAIRQRIIAHKRARRIAVGDRVTMLFEDRATVWYQIQEMLWVEHLTELDAVRGELEVYNALVPGAAELSTTLFIEIEDQSRVREALNQLAGIDEHLTLEVGTAGRARGVFEVGRQSEEKLSAVQYVRFPLDPAMRAGIAAGAPLALVIDHPSYRVRSTLPEAFGKGLARDLLDAAAADAALRKVRDGG